MHFTSAIIIPPKHLNLLISSRVFPSITSNNMNDSSPGPAFWHEVFPQACSGASQSPIDIRSEETVYDPRLKDFAIYYDPPKPDSKMFIKNNGHTGRLKNRAGLQHMSQLILHFLKL